MTMPVRFNEIEGKRIPGRIKKKPAGAYFAHLGSTGGAVKAFVNGVKRTLYNVSAKFAEALRLRN